MPTDYVTTLATQLETDQWIDSLYGGDSRERPTWSVQMRT